MVNISQMVKFHRKKSGLTQKELADLAGVGKTVIFDIEKGKETIQFYTLQKVLNVLNITLEFKSPLMNEINGNTDC
jgi:y4mF family transcriptional regulator